MGQGRSRIPPDQLISEMSVRQQPIPILVRDRGVSGRPPELIFAAISLAQVETSGTVPRDQERKQDDKKRRGSAPTQKSLRAKTTVGGPAGSQESSAAGRHAHLGQEILEEVQQVLHGVKIYEVDELGQALHHRRKEGRRRRSTLQDAKVGKHHLGGKSARESGVEGNRRRRQVCRSGVPRATSPVEPDGRGSDHLGDQVCGVDGNTIKTAHNCCHGPSSSENARGVNRLLQHAQTKQRLLSQ